MPGRSLAAPRAVVRRWVEDLISQGRDSRRTEPLATATLVSLREGDGVRRRTGCYPSELRGPDLVLFGVSTTGPRRLATRWRVSSDCSCCPASVCRWWCVIAWCLAAEGRPGSRPTRVTPGCLAGGLMCGRSRPATAGWPGWAGEWLHSSGLWGFPLPGGAGRAGWPLLDTGLARCGDLTAWAAFGAGGPFKPRWCQLGTQGEARTPGRLAGLFDSP